MFPSLLYFGKPSKVYVQFSLFFICASLVMSPGVLILPVITAVISSGLLSCWSAVSSQALVTLMFTVSSGRMNWLVIVNPFAWSPVTSLS